MTKRPKTAKKTSTKDDLARNFPWLLIKLPSNSFYIIDDTQGVCQVCNSVISLVRDTLNKHQISKKHVELARLKANNPITKTLLVNDKNYSLQEFA